MSDVPEIEVPDDVGVFLAISAGNYHDADMAFWSLKDRLRGKFPSPGEAAHLQQLRDTRKKRYGDLVSWVMSVEAMRLGVKDVQVTPVTSARGSDE